MAKFGYWGEWRQMARDLMRGLYQLGDENIKKEGISKIKSTWTKYVPTVTPVGAMTYAPIDFSCCYWRKVGSAIEIKISVTATVGGTATHRVWFSLPAEYPAKELSTYTIMNAQVTQTSYACAGIAVVRCESGAAPQRIAVGRHDNSNFVTGESLELLVVGSYIVD